MGMTLLALLWCPAQDGDEARLRSEFTEGLKSTETAKRVEAVKKLAGAKEEKTVEALAGALKDAEKDVKKSAAETLAACADGAGVAIKPLRAVLLNKQEHPDVLNACAQAIAKSRYRTEPVETLIEVISAIQNTDRHLHEFGKNATVLLEKMTGEEGFGYGRNTPYLWSEWWKENKAKFQKEDETKRAEYAKERKK